MKAPIFILTLEDAMARRAPLIASLEAEGISYELWYGIDGRKGLDAEFEAMIDRDAARQTMRRDMGDGEFACALSHHFIYREILSRDLPFAVVLEDDAIIDTPFFSFLDQIDTAQYDLLMLDHMRADIFRRARINVGKGLWAYRLAFSPMLTTGYIISQAGARIMVDQSLPISAPADWPIDVSQMRSFAVDPRIVDHPDQDTGASYIRHERVPTPRPKNRASRFLEATYWKKTYKKRTSVRIS